MPSDYFQTFNSSDFNSHCFLGLSFPIGNLPKLVPLFASLGGLEIYIFYISKNLLLMLKCCCHDGVTDFIRIVERNKLTTFFKCGLVSDFLESIPRTPRSSH